MSVAGKIDRVKAITHVAIRRRRLDVSSRGEDVGLAKEDMETPEGIAQSREGPRRIKRNNQRKGNLASDHPGVLHIAG
jgi:hypothetical protein